MFYVYFLCLQNGTVYTGSTSDLRRRIQEHSSGKVRSTNKRESRLIEYEAYVKKTDATRREGFLKTTEGKRLFRQQYRDIININAGGSPRHATGRPIE